MKFVVTGGIGFIGSNIVKHLLTQNHEVTVVDDFSRGRLENLAGFEEQVDLQKLNIQDFDSLKDVINDSDGIFHQAALTSVPESFIQKEKYHSVNVVGTENIFKLAKEFSIKVVYASSSSVYGNTIAVPVMEDLERKPINPYGITKLDDEILAAKYHDLGASIIGLRYFNVYGIGQTNDYAGVITKFYDNIQADMSPIIFGDGSQTRDFVSVEDVANANLLAMQSNTDFTHLNIGTGIMTLIQELANLMIKLSGKSLEIKFDELPQGDIKESQADVSFAKKMINWSHETSLEDGLKNFFF